jgi:hypothetical protein
MADPLENPVTVETPLETVETPLETVENSETVETPLETIETPLETVETPVETPKKKVRPAGAKSSVQGKPRPKRVAANRVRKESVQPDEPDFQGDELPPPLPNSHRIPQISNDDSSARMLALLRQQAADRRQRKVDVWKSWFN